MILDSVHVTNFRSILNARMTFESVTALVGANGTGKSSFLHAIELFYSRSPKVEIQDFYNGDASDELVVAITYKELSAEATGLFAGYLQDGKLTVERVFVHKDGKTSHKYHGASLQNNEFQAIRAAFATKDRGKTAKESYEAIRSRPEYGALPPWTTIQQASGALKEWEGANSDTCSRTRDDGQFFGF
jgi:putative ATP-dependent endonuclease of OLD family